MSDEGEHTEAEYVLVMPFVVTSSHGGPYDDEAWVAGCEFGSINRMLDLPPPEAGHIDLTVRTGNVPQFDLAAMHHGWTMQASTWDEDENWSLLAFDRVVDV